MHLPPVSDPRVNDWLAQHAASIQPLRAPSLQAELPAGTIIDKVGMLPVAMKDGKLYVRLAKPLAKKPELGDPGFQLPKGTRQFWDEVTHQWQDIGRGHDPANWDGVTLETVEHAALRESIEEVGTRPENLGRVWNLGPITVKSASKGSDKLVHMFAAEVRDMEAFDAPDGAHADAANVQWFALPEHFVPYEKVSAEQPIRPDHAVFLAGLRNALKPVMDQGASLQR